jgi:hypothetical protein
LRGQSGSLHVFWAFAHVGVPQIVFNEITHNGPAEARARLGNKDWKATMKSLGKDSEGHKFV